MESFRDIRHETSTAKARRTTSSEERRQALPRRCPRATSQIHARRRTAIAHARRSCRLNTYSVTAALHVMCRPTPIALFVAAAPNTPPLFVAVNMLSLRSPQMSRRYATQRQQPSVYSHSDLMAPAFSNRNPPPHAMLYCR